MNLPKKNRIYLDFAATTPMDPLVLREMQPYFSEKFGNPNSPHETGREALLAVDSARDKTAELFNSESEEIVFTSGATESNNLAIRGVIKKYQKVLKIPEIITTKIEHPSVLNTCRDLERQGVVVKYLPVKNNGIVDVSKLSELVSENTALISVMYVNNEIGTIQPVREIGKFVTKLNLQRKTPITFHTDAVQAVGSLNCDVKHLHVDLLSASGHKIYGPKGVGCLYIKSGTPIMGIQTGGDQESGLRAGTLDVPSIVGFGKASELCIRRGVGDKKRMSKLRDWAFTEIMHFLPEAQISGEVGDLRIPNNLHLRVDGVDGNDIMFLMDNKFNISVSTGSACTVGAAEPSKVLREMGINKTRLREGVRVTIGRTTTKAEMIAFIKAYVSCIAIIKK
ncbi:MAG: cysteine desulfurase family protein [Patescibacteria group bacterium]|jgi:cysteine desulfurase